MECSGPKILSVVLGERLKVKTVIKVKPVLDIGSNILSISRKAPREAHDKFAKALYEGKLTCHVQKLVRRTLARKPRKIII
jgi:hypothetical protein